MSSPSPEVQHHKRGVSLMPVDAIPATDVINRNVNVNNTASKVQKVSTHTGPTNPDPSRNDVRLREHERQLYTTKAPPQSSGPTTMTQPNPYRQAANVNMGSLQELHLSAPDVHVTGGTAQPLASMTSRAWPSTGLVMTHHAELVAMLAEQKQLILATRTQVPTPSPSIPPLPQPSAAASLSAALIRIDVLEREVQALRLIVRQLQEKAGLTVTA